jgi:hypothetical protein
LVSLGVGLVCDLGLGWSQQAAPWTCMVLMPSCLLVNPAVFVLLRFPSTFAYTIVNLMFSCSSNHAASLQAITLVPNCH